MKRINVIKKTKAKLRKFKKKRKSLTLDIAAKERDSFYYTPNANQALHVMVSHYTNKIIKHKAVLKTLTKYRLC